MISIWQESISEILLWLSLSTSKYGVLQQLSILQFSCSLSFCLLLTFSSLHFLQYATGQNSVWWLDDFLLSTWQCPCADWKQTLESPDLISSNGQSAALRPPARWRYYCQPGLPKTINTEQK